MADQADTGQRNPSITGIPSDLPESPLNYPGKPLSHRYAPATQPRMVEQFLAPSGPKLATENNFKPIASVSFPDKNIYLAPVQNSSPREIKPVGLTGSVTLPVSGDRVVNLGQDLTGPTQARVERITRPPAPVTTTYATSQVATTNQTILPRSWEKSKSELDKLKEEAVKELQERRMAAAAREQSPTAQVNRETVVQQQAVVEPTQAATTEVKTEKLLEEAQKLEAELEKIRDELLPGKPPAPIEMKPIPQVQKEPVPAPLPIETKPVVEPPKASVEETPVVPTKERELEERINALVIERGELLKQQGSLSATIQGEQEKRRAAETALDKANKDFQTKLQQIQIEKTNLLAKVKELEDTLNSLKDLQKIGEAMKEQAADYRSRLEASEKEKQASLEKMKKLESFLEEIRAGQARQPVESAKPVVTPQVVEPPKPVSPSVKVVKPQLAVGKMAPSLTTAPNVINGVIKDTDGLLLQNAVIVVKDESGEPVRALKTNKIGQFAISTPLPNGTFNMEIESPGHSFDVVQVEVKGDVMPPIEIRAHN